MSPALGYVPSDLQEKSHSGIAWANITVEERYMDKEEEDPKFKRHSWT